MTPVPVVKIDYSADFMRIMGYFRRVLVNEEYSDRALKLCASPCRERHGHSPALHGM